MIEGLSHITFIVRDLGRMAAFLEGIFGAKAVYASGDKTFSRSREMFFLIGNLWIAVMEGEALEKPTYNHIAFKISESDFDAYEKRVREAAVTILPPRPRITGEGRSLYFYDFDNHLFELHTGTLEQRLESYHQGIMA